MRLSTLSIIWYLIVIWKDQKLSQSNDAAYPMHQEEREAAKTHTHPPPKKTFAIIVSNNRNFIMQMFDFHCQGSCAVSSKRWQKLPQSINELLLHFISESNANTSYKCLLFQYCVLLGVWSKYQNVISWVRYLISIFKCNKRSVTPIKSKHCQAKLFWVFNTNVTIIFFKQNIFNQILTCEYGVNKCTILFHQTLQKELINMQI